MNNASWLTKLNYIQFLRDIGSHFTINKMLTFDSVKLRLEESNPLAIGINYMILQGTIFISYLKKKLYFANWRIRSVGNIINGTDLIRRMTQKEAYGLTSPLITLASGAKMGKTEKGAIISEDQLSPYNYWQFWRNTDDRDVKKFLNYFTEIDPKEVETIFIKEKNINNLKILLANEATKILHGKIAANKAEQTARDTFEKGGLGVDLPEIKININEVKKGIDILDFISK